MNILPGRVGWLLPPRCACRYTMGLMWKYGLEEISYHDMDPEADVDRILMNVRNPYTRLRSWLRLWNNTISPHIDAVDYFQNLHTTEFQKPIFVSRIENPNGRDFPWKYPAPLSAYTDGLARAGRHVDTFIRQEHLEVDLEAAGYPILDYVFTDSGYKKVPVTEEEIVQEIRIGFSPIDNTQMWESGDGLTDLEFYRANPTCAAIVRLYYDHDFVNFGYSFDPEDLKD